MIADAGAGGIRHPDFIGIAAADCHATAGTCIVVPFSVLVAVETPALILEEGEDEARSNRAGSLPDSDGQVVGAALDSDWDRIDLHIVVPLSDDLPIQVGDKTLISSDVERYGSIAVQVEEGLEGDQPADWRGVSLVVPDPESARA